MEINLKVADLDLFWLFWRFKQEVISGLEQRSNVIPWANVTRTQQAITFKELIES
jgi:hypothetical protein